MKKLTRENLLDILYGCAIVGTGGGGSLKGGIEKIEEALKLGREFILADLDELEEDALVATPYSCGAISPLTEAERKKYEGLPDAPEDMHIMALRELEKHLGREVKAVISTELGGGNTATAFYAGAMSGKYIVDGDPAGRSVPELQHSTYYLNHIKIQPIALVNKFGEAAILTSVVDDFRAEALVRAIAVASQNTIAVVDHAAPVRELKNAVIRGAITNTMAIGEAFRRARAGGGDVASATASQGGGTVIFRGRVEANDWSTVDGFTVGYMTICGEGSYKGDEFRIWYKNENLVTWKNGKYDVTVPDLVCVINDDAKEPLLNPYGQVGMNVSVIVLPAPAVWTSEAGLQLFGPRSFGHEIDWKPCV